MHREADKRIDGTWRERKRVVHVSYPDLYGIALKAYIEENGTFVPLAASAIKHLIRERDEEVREAAISTIENRLNYHRHPGTKKEV